MQESWILTLFDLYSDMVYRLAFSYLRSPQDAEDAVQSIFLKLIEGKGMPETGKEKAFLTKITVNHCRDVLRSSFRKRVVPLDETIPFEEKEDRELFAAVMSLEEKYRIPIYLHYYEGYSFPEIAAFLKISPSGVSMRIHRGRTKLKKQLKEDRI